MIVEFINEYGTTILYAVLTAIAGYIGIAVKTLYTKYINDKTKKDVVKTVVLGIEQIYKDLHGHEKLEAALKSASDMLAEKGISVTDLELRMLIEAAVAEFNEAFKRGDSNLSAPITYTDEAGTHGEDFVVETMELEQLRAVASQMGLDVPDDATSEDLIAAIGAAASYD